MNGRHYIGFGWSQNRYRFTENKYAMTNTVNIHEFIINDAIIRIEPLSLVTQLNSDSQYLPNIYYMIK